MIHGVFFLLIVGLVLGFGAIVRLRSVGRKEDDKVMTWYVGLMSCIGGAVFTDLLAVYLALVGADSEIVPLLAAIVYHALLGCLSVFLILFTLEISGSPVRGNKNRLLWVQAPVLPILVVFSILFGLELLAYVGEFWILAVATWAVIQYYPRSKDPRIRVRYQPIATTLTILFSVFLPLFLMEILFETFLFPAESVFLETSLLLLILYLVWSGLNFGPLYRYFQSIQSSTISHGDKTVENDERWEQFGLTEREREIVSRILDGDSNKMIGSSLSISPSTVKNHISTIFRKTSVASRMELFNLTR